MPTFTHSVDYENDYYTVEIGVYDNFDADLDVTPGEFFEACDSDDLATLFEKFLNYPRLGDVLDEIDESLLSTLRGLLYPIDDDNEARDTLTRIPSHEFAEYATWEQIAALLNALSGSRNRALSHVWCNDIPSETRHTLLTILHEHTPGYQEASPATDSTRSFDPFEDVLDLLNDVDEDRLLGLPDTTLDRLRSILLTTNEAA